jgi:hypothetical protein
VFDGAPADIDPAFEQALYVQDGMSAQHAAAGPSGTGPVADGTACVVA